VPSWLPPVLVVLVVGLLVVALDIGRRDREGPRPDDAHWLAGVIYFNRNDERIMVPKRFGLGFGRTLNFAHPVAWLVVLGTLVIALVGALSHRS
jgi:uncharacterized membrane protein